MAALNRTIDAFEGFSQTRPLKTRDMQIYVHACIHTFTYVLHAIKHPLTYMCIYMYLYFYPAYARGVRKILQISRGLIIIAVEFMYTPNFVLRQYFRNDPSSLFRKRLIS